MDGVAGSPILPQPIPVCRDMTKKPAGLLRRAQGLASSGRLLLLELQDPVWCRILLLFSLRQAPWQDLLQQQAGVELQ